MLENSDRLQDDNYNLKPSQLSQEASQTSLEERHCRFGCRNLQDPQVIDYTVIIH